MPLKPIGTTRLMLLMQLRRPKPPMRPMRPMKWETNKAAEADRANDPKLLNPMRQLRPLMLMMPLRQMHPILLTRLMRQMRMQPMKTLGPMQPTGPIRPRPLWLMKWTRLLRPMRPIWSSRLFWLTRSLQSTEPFGQQGCQCCFGQQGTMRSMRLLQPRVWWGRCIQFHQCC